LEFFVEFPEEHAVALDVVEHDVFAGQQVHLVVEHGVHLEVQDVEALQRASPERTLLAHLLNVDWVVAAHDKHVIKEHFHLHVLRGFLTDLVM